MASAPLARIPGFRGDPDIPVATGTSADLADLLRDSLRPVAVTGAGCSTGSGIPAYRNPDGKWQRRTPIFYQDFLRQDRVRRRYWARSFFGWSVIRRAEPGPAHHALAGLRQLGLVRGLITQNVDGLHRRAGVNDVIELHGGLHNVLCLKCGTPCGRDALQQRLAALNPEWSPDVLDINPDGDAELDEQAYPGFRVADCEACGGMLKPDVVFFGESVPRARLAAADRLIDQADALIIIGSSLVVWSGYRLARRAAAAGTPIVAVNDGRTRADALLRFKVSGDCGRALQATLTHLRSH